MIIEHEICRACATGDSKQKHNQDSKTCRFGRLRSLNFLPEEEQIEALRAEECFSKEIAEMIVGLSKERNVSILEVLEEEKLLA
jgi:hypothetical protein